jgi:hypothetical protein
MVRQIEREYKLTGEINLPKNKGYTIDYII